MDHSQFLLLIACLLGFFMAWGVGANDVANAMGTSVGSKALTIKQAIFIAAILEMAGALFAGGEVTNTIRSGIIDSSALADQPDTLVYGMLSALMSAGLWLLIATNRGWPVSTTHSIVGAIIGFGAVTIGFNAIHWFEVFKIASSWVITPIIAGFIAYGIFNSIQILILNTDKPLYNAKRYAPIYIFIVALVVSMVTLVSGLKHLGFHLSFLTSLLISLTFSGIVMGLGALLLRKIHSKSDVNPKFDFKNVEKTFGVLMIFTACCMAFAHGSNDVANAIGPLAAVVSVLKTGTVTQNSPLPFWVLGLGGLGIVAGLSTYGYKVIRTIGTKITELTPTRGFAAELATASTIVIASGTGLPVSTTHTLVGAVLGVGFARGIGALDLKVISNIFLSWIITLPVGAGFAVIFYYLLRMIL